MTVKERILMIRLIDGITKYPAYAKALGIEATGAANNQKKDPDPRGLTDM